MKRFPLMIVIVLALAALWSGFWYYVAGRISDEVQTLAQSDGITAPRITCQTFTVSGFPFHFSLICDGAEITSGDLTLSLPQVSGTALFYRPTHVQLFFDSPARLADAFTGSAQELQWETMRASVRLQGDRVARISMIGDNLVHADALFNEMVLGSANHVELHLVDATPSDAPVTGGQTLDIFARLDGTTIAGLDIENGDGRIDGRLTGVPSLDLLGHPELLRLWQMAGGELTLRGFEAKADGLEITAQGEASLDETGRLNASLEVSSNGLVERLPGLAEDPVAAMFLGHPDDSGTYSQTMSVRGGTVFVGILPVLSLEPVF